MSLNGDEWCRMDGLGASGVRGTGEGVWVCTEQLRSGVSYSTGSMMGSDRQGCVSSLVLPLRVGDASSNVLSLVLPLREGDASSDAFSCVTVTLSMLLWLPPEPESSALGGDSLSFRADVLAIIPSQCQVSDGKGLRTCHCL